MANAGIRPPPTRPVGSELGVGNKPDDTEPKQRAGATGAGMKVPLHAPEEATAVRPGDVLLDFSSDSDWMHGNIVTKGV